MHRKSQGSFGGGADSGGSGVGTRGGFPPVDACFLATLQGASPSSPAVSFAPLLFTLLARRTYGQWLTRPYPSPCALLLCRANALVNGPMAASLVVSSGHGLVSKRLAQNGYRTKSVPCNTFKGLRPERGPGSRTLFSVSPLPPRFLQDVFCWPRRPEFLRPCVHILMYT